MLVHDQVRDGQGCTAQNWGPTETKTNISNNTMFKGALETQQLFFLKISCSINGAVLVVTE